MDIWYTSPVLYHYLQGRKMSAVDTAKVNRQYMPKDLKPVQKDEVHFQSSGNGMLCLCWLDSKLVDAEHGPHLKDGSGTPIIAPDEALMRCGIQLWDERSGSRGIS